MPAAIEQMIVDVRCGGNAFGVATLIRRAEQIPLFFLHGVGGSKEDYADGAIHPELAGRTIIATDLPGFGGSTATSYSTLDIDELTNVVAAVVEHLQIETCHLVGHSLGGLVGLSYAERCPDRVASFVNIEGNLAPEDCFLSRQVVQHSESDPSRFLDGLAKRMRLSGRYGEALAAAGLSAKAQARALHPIFQSMIVHSDERPLLATFLELACPRLFMHGEQNASLSYLPQLAQAGVNVACIPHSGHYPMYSNAPAMWRAIIDFVTASEAGPADG
jgi:pimeloyl-ACP methyl ester carboxylesterase